MDNYDDEDYTYSLVYFKLKFSPTSYMYNSVAHFGGVMSGLVIEREKKE